jgi:Major Facilitator Superfamily
MSCLNQDWNFVWSLATFGIGSIVTVLPSTLLFRKIGPALWFAVSSLMWGLVAASTAGVKDVGGFISTRMLLGITQSGFVPCIMLYIVYFYTKEETAVRFASIICVAASMQAACGFFSHHVSRTDFSSNLSGWQSVFLLDGVFFYLNQMFGIVMGVITWFYLPSYPETCSFLNQADRVLAVARGKDGIEQATSVGLHKTTKIPLYTFEIVQLTDALKDVQTWLLALTYLLITVASDSLIVLAPSVSTTSFDITSKDLSKMPGDQIEAVIDSFENSTIPITFLATLPYVFAVVASILLARYCQEREKRPWPAAVSLFVSAGGFAVMAFVSPAYPGGGAARYFLGLLPAVIGLFCATPLVLSYGMDRAIEDTYRASVFGANSGICN